MRALVTGAAGFAGGHLLALLRANGHDVMGLDRQERRDSIGCDLTNYGKLEEVILSYKPDAIFHLAGMSQTGGEPALVPNFVHANVLATSHLCKAAAKLEKVFLLYVSSGLVFGYPQENRPFSEEDMPRPHNMYAKTKYMAEQVVELYNGVPGFNGYIVRPFNHIGPRQGLQFVVSDFCSRIHQATDGDEMIVGDLTSERDFTDVRDIVRAYSLIAERRPKQKLFVLSSGRTVAVGKILEELLDIAQKRLRIKSTIDAKRGETGPKQIYGDSSLAYRVLGWSPEIDLKTSLEDAYRDHISTLQE